MELAEIFSLIISVVSLALSGILWSKDKEAGKASHEFDLFRDTYQEHLVRKIPAARSKLIITQSGMISGEDALISELISVRKASLYFQYADNDFFVELRQRLWDLEDYLTMLESPLVGESRQNFEYNIQNKLAHIYKFILGRF